jgi:hypothetical protein
LLCETSSNRGCIDHHLQNTKSKQKKGGRGKGNLQMESGGVEEDGERERERVLESERYLLFSFVYRGEHSLEHM